jgi:hypothetical protein
MVAHLSPQATQEAEMWRIVVPGQPGQRVYDTPSQQKKAGRKKTGLKLKD